MTRRALIVGGGIGGLTAAVALRRAGFDAVVLERAPELRELGAAISLWPNAVSVLRRLGLGETIETLATVQAEGGLRTWRGDRLADAPLGRAADRFGAPRLLLHRASLQASLSGALDAGVLQLGSECCGVQQDANHATVALAGGRSERGDFVIGADGLHSMVRAHAFGEEPPRYSGYVSWRAVVPLDETLGGRIHLAESWGRGSLFGINRLGGSQIFWYASAHASEDAGGSAFAEKAELLRRFGRWHDPIPELIDATAAEAIVRTRLYDRPPLARWSAGRMALLGDAAHPMLPHLAQGACQAIEDAAVLADELAGSRDVEGALAAYGKRRSQRAAMARRRSQQVASFAHLSNPIAVGLRTLAFRSAFPSAFARGLSSVVDDECRQPHRRRESASFPRK
jgi:2-polyprenyl-6-methoxyphenol hydroxylase-like FAD-dependent oxidoreductase